MGNYSAPDDPAQQGYLDRDGLRGASFLAAVAADTARVIIDRRINALDAPPG